MSLLLPLSLLFLLLAHSTAQFITVVNSTKTYASVPPTWLTSPFFRAGNQAVITTLTGNTATPVFTFTFSSPLTGVPAIAYGIKNYRGNDYMGQEFYEIKMIGLTQATFTVQIQIYGVTNLWLLAVAYLAVEPTFPHHFNTFDNVPLNYSSGPIVNISTKTTAVTFFTEYINYTQQASARTYKTFTNPLSSNIIVLFMTSLWIQGTFYVYPVKFHITPQVINSQIYSLNATLQTQVMITNVHFSMVIFNTKDIESSNQYQVVYYQWDNDIDGGWRSLPAEFIDNFIMGVTAFESVDAACGFQYQWEFANDTNGVFGVQVLRSWTISNTCGFSYSQTSVLYISTWLCLPPYIYFNISTQLCQDMCGGYFLQNANTSSCVQCTNPMCYTCDSSNSSYCIECAAFDHMTWVNGSCQCYSGYFYLTGKCVTCDSSNPGCLDCSYSVVSTILPFNSSDFTCYSCNQTQNYFLASDSCVKCTIPHCITCSSLSSCQLCDTGYSVDYSQTCSTCAVLGCFTCIPSDNHKCATCYSAGGFYIVPATQQCSSSCGDALTAIGMEACDDGNNNDADGCSSTCTLQPYFNCTILANFTTVCLPVCGDNVQNGGEACDDGNLIDGDGCNHLCKIQIVLSLQSQIRNLEFCNNLKFGFNVLPYSSFMDTLNFTSFIVFNSTSLINSIYSYSQQKLLSISYDFDRDMVSQYLQMTENTTMAVQYSNYTFIFTPQTFKIDPQNNVAANYLDADMCSEKKLYEQSYQVLEIASYATLFLTMLPGKIIGLELFGVLQLAYFSVGSIDSVNVLLSPLMNMKGLNGYSQPISHSKNEELPRRVKEIHHYPTFLDNFNVMFLLMFLQLFIGIVLYVFAKLTITQSKTLMNIANKLLKQVFLTIVLFNCFNISYSFAIYFRYSGDSLDNLNLVISIMSLAALVLMSFLVTYVNPQGFGQFKQKFKKDFIQTSYMAISILYRTSIGFLLAYSNDDDLSTLFALGISLTFLLYNLVNLPFVKAYHNYRACLCHLTQFITLFVAMYYRSMKSTTSPTIVASIFSPAKIEFFLLFSCLFVSIAVLVYDAFHYVKAICSSNKVQQTDKRQKSRVEEESQGNVMGNEILQTQNDIFGTNHSINPIKPLGS